MKKIVSEMRKELNTHFKMDYPEGKTLKFGYEISKKTYKKKQFSLNRFKEEIDDWARFYDKIEVTTLKVKREKV